MKDRFYREVEHVFNKCPKFHTKILLGDINSKVGREAIFKPKIGNESYTKLVMIRRVITSTGWKSLVFPMIPREMPVRAEVPGRTTQGGKVKDEGRS
jgi:hypothetical protein